MFGLGRGDGSSIAVREKFVAVPSILALEPVPRGATTVSNPFRKDHDFFTGFRHPGLGASSNVVLRLAVLPGRTRGSSLSVSRATMIFAPRPSFMNRNGLL